MVDEKPNEDEIWGVGEYSCTIVRVINNFKLKSGDTIDLVEYNDYVPCNTMETTINVMDLPEFKRRYEFKEFG